MAVIFLGVRHHSPACARLVADTIRSVRPAYVLVEGPADMNHRMDGLLLGHELPIAVYTSYRDHERRHGSWTPLCDYSPEWAALTAGREAGAELRFIDLPAWHPALAGLSNRYADAESRYNEVTGRLCRVFAVDNVDALWDHLVEIAPADGLAERLATYFDLVRGDTETGPDDTAREAYMAQWVRAAAGEAGERPVVVVTGGFHRPALMRLAGQGERSWPEVPQPPEGAAAGSFLVPYSFRRLDAFAGYQSGMPSPGYYQDLWECGPQGGRPQAHRGGGGEAAGPAPAGVDRRSDRRAGHLRCARVDARPSASAARPADRRTDRHPWAARRSGPPRPGPRRRAAPTSVTSMAAVPRLARRRCGVRVRDACRPGADARIRLIHTGRPVSPVSSRLAALRPSPGVGAAAQAAGRGRADARRGREPAGQQVRAR